MVLKQAFEWPPTGQGHTKGSGYWPRSLTEPPAAGCLTVRLPLHPYQTRRRRNLRRPFKSIPMFLNLINMLFYWWTIFAVIRVITWTYFFTYHARYYSIHHQTITFHISTFFRTEGVKQRCVSRLVSKLTMSHYLQVHLAWHYEEASNFSKETSTRLRSVLFT